MQGNAWTGNDSFGTRQSKSSKKFKSRYINIYVGKHLEVHTRMWTASIKSHPSWAQYLATWEPPSSQVQGPFKTRFKELLMGGPLYSEGTGLLLAGAAVFVVGFFVFCCIDHCWLRRDLRKADRWSIFPSSSSNSNSASDSMYSPWQLSKLGGYWYIFPSPNFISHPEYVAVLSQPSSQCLQSCVSYHPTFAAVIWI